MCRGTISVANDMPFGASSRLRRCVIRSRRASLVRQGSSRPITAWCRQGRGVGFIGLRVMVGTVALRASHRGRRLTTAIRSRVVGFASDTAVRANGEGHYATEIMSGWDVVGNANGGYLLSVAARRCGRLPSAPIQ